MRATSKAFKLITINRHKLDTKYFLQISDDYASVFDTISCMCVLLRVFQVFFFFLLALCYKFKATQVRIFEFE